MDASYLTPEVKELKRLTRVAVEMAGGPKAIAAASRFHASHISEYCDDTKPGSVIPGDAILIVETMARTICITEFLCRQRGGTFVRNQRVKPVAKRLDRIADLTVENAALESFCIKTPNPTPGEEKQITRMVAIEKDTLTDISDSVNGARQEVAA